jgi:hypothetical protein
MMAILALSLLSGGATSSRELERAYTATVVPYYTSRGWVDAPLVTGTGYVECDPIRWAYKGRVVNCTEYVPGAEFGFIHHVTFTDYSGGFSIELADDGSIPDVHGHL